MRIVVACLALVAIGCGATPPTPTEEAAAFFRDVVSCLENNRDELIESFDMETAENLGEYEDLCRLFLEELSPEAQALVTEQGKAIMGEMMSAVMAAGLAMLSGTADTAAGDLVDSLAEALEVAAADLETAEIE